MTPISAEDQKAKMEFIRAFFDDFDKKVGYLAELYESDHRDEARILCSCYIDSLASALYWPDERSNFNYVRGLREHSGQDLFSHIHPKMLDEALTKLSKRGLKWTRIHASISSKLQGADNKLYSEQQIIVLLTPLLSALEMEHVKRELWRGTFASVVYDRFRVAAVHGFGPPDGTTFNHTTFKGQPVPPIDFSIVHDCLKRVIAFSRELSAKTGKWFGHDFKATS
jgi:hypothetical protein